jgi:hypothetical protein
MLKGCDGDKSPDPDGFNFRFIKQFWSLVKGDIMEMVNEFYSNAQLPKSLLFYFVALIPKVSNPHKLNEFRPISFLGCLYETISKLLADRLKLVLHEIISEHQSALIPGKMLLDSVMVANETLDFARKKSQTLFYVKN